MLPILLAGVACKAKEHITQEFHELANFLISYASCLYSFLWLSYVYLCDVVCHGHACILFFNQ